MIVVAALGTGIAVFTWPPGPIRFGQFSAAQFTQQLTPLFLVALLIERSLEVFLTTWRGPGLAVLQRSVDQKEQMMAAGAAILPDLHQAQDALTNYKSATQQIAMPSALVLGVLISALGIRCLGNLVAADAFTGHPTQQAWFTVADVLLTGALVGGGSDFVHQFITSLTNFMNKTKS
ncbi:MAG TPA: hypothetical protein VGW33_11915 [Terriglobia bacterium]|nr:hypothetical protein [Terriglobia bacterium]